MSQHRRIRGHFPPPQKDKPFLPYNNFKHLLGLVFAQFVLGKEKHAHTVFPFFPDRNAQRLCHLLKKLMGYLGKNSYSVPGFAFCVLPCPVLKIFHYLKSIFHTLTAFHTLNIDAGANTAVIVLKLWTV